ncbi:dermonecrotic toxin SPH-like isoform X1 [Amblyomma americanum]
MLPNFKTALAVAAFSALLEVPFAVTASGLRPVYIIGHMVNSISEIDAAMRQKANSIESDVDFDKNGNATWFYHGTPCDCFRTCLSSERVPAFLQYIRQSTHPNGGKYREKLLLLFLDLKVKRLDSKKKYWAGTDVATKLLRHLWEGVPPTQAMNVLVSVPSYRDKDVLRGVIDTIQRQAPALLAKTGFDISDIEDLSKIRSVYQELGIRENRWQGDGTTNCISFLRSHSRMRRVVANRDLNSADHYVDKAYHWTVDIPDQLRRSLRIGVDGIITNKPERLASIVTEREFRTKLRRATIDDNPWTRFRA